MAKNASAKQTFTATWKYNDEDAGYLRLMKIMIVLMRSQFVTLLTRDPSPYHQPGSVGTSVAGSRTIFIICSFMS